MDGVCRNCNGVFCRIKFKCLFGRLFVHLIRFFQLILMKFVFRFEVYVQLMSVGEQNGVDIFCLWFMGHCNEKSSFFVNGLLLEVLKPELPAVSVCSRFSLSFISLCPKGLR